MKIFNHYIQFSIVLLLYLLVIISCKKEFEDYNSVNANFNNNIADASYVVAVNQSNGETQFLKSFNTNKDYYITEAQTLIHKSQLDVIKKYPSKYLVDLGEVKSLLSQKRSPRSNLSYSKQVRYNMPNVRYVKPSVPVCISKGANLWYRNRVRIIISKELPCKSIPKVVKAIEIWQAHTKSFLSWEYKTSSNMNISDGATRVLPTPSLKKECVSTVGERPGNEGVIYVSEECTVGDIMRTLGHVLGFVDEQRRPKASQYISVSNKALATVKKKLGESTYLDIKTTLFSTEPVQNDNIDFDFASVMLAPPFSNDIFVEKLLKNINLPLYTKKNGSKIEVPTCLSSLDIAKAWQVYPPIKCSE